ncbi:hypothetical protein FRC03_011030 [Tulasnella sp. 419]|nr:hypothetical protein FRC03_011030 [Tulasnella sp. 419]
MAHLRLFSCGSNAKGQLSNSNTNDTYTFQSCSFIPSSSDIRDTVSSVPHGVQHIHKIVGGANHTLLLVEYKGFDGVSHQRLYGCGDPSRGQLGPDLIEHSNVTNFTRIQFPNFEDEGFDVVDVAAAWETTYVVFRPRKGQGSPSECDILVSMGSNDMGDLGIASAQSTTVIGASSGKGKAKLPNIAQPQFNIVPISTLTNRPYQITKLAAGPHHVVVIVEQTHDQKSAGQNSSDQLIIGWGACRHGQLGHIPMSSSSKKRTTTACLKTMYPLFIPTPTILSIPSIKPDRVVGVAAGNQHTVFLTSDGTLYSVGSNRKSQLEGLENLASVGQLGCSWNSTYAVVTSQDNETEGCYIVATGSGERGQLGISNSEGSSSSSSMKRADTSNESCNGTGRTALPTSNRKIVKLACGSEHVLAVLERYSGSPPMFQSKSSEIWGWGWNEHGNLGLGHNQDIHTPVKIWPQGQDGSRELSDVRDWIVVGAWAGCGTSWLAVRRSNCAE